MSKTTLALLNLIRAGIARLRRKGRRSAATSSEGATGAPLEPWMDDRDIKLIEDLLTGLKRRHVRVLEWGAGGSTRHFTSFLKSRGITYDWVSIEYNREWYEKVLALDLPNVDLHLFDVGNTSLEQVDTNMDEYVEFPVTLNRSFDFILVDGRKRRRCLINAARLVTEDGCVVLHDAQREYYHCAFDHYPEGKFLSQKLWVGYARPVELA